jgi:hypothetical protein
MIVDTVQVIERYQEDDITETLPQMPDTQVLAQIPRRTKMEKLMVYRFSQYQVYLFKLSNFLFINEFISTGERTEHLQPWQLLLCCNGALGVWKPPNAQPGARHNCRLDEDNTTVHLFNPLCANN